MSELAWNRWRRNADLCPDKDAIIHWVAGEEPFRWTRAALLTASENMAAMLLDHRIRKGDVCAIITRHHKQFYPLYLALTCVGAIPAVLAYPNPRLHPEKFRQGLEGMSKRSGLDWILAERELEHVVRPVITDRSSTIRGLHFPFEWHTTPEMSDTARAQIASIQATLDAEAPLLLQHSSGTTGLQKPVVLSHSCVLQHVEHYGEAIALTADDKVVSWLPLYHDMGLIAAFHLPLAWGIPTVLLDPFEWVVCPSLLPEVVSRERGTLSWLPNFAYNMMASKIRDDETDGFRLDSWRLIVNCSEPVRNESHERFLARFQRNGLRASALSTSYAMAETTFAVTQTLQGELRRLAVDPDELSKGRVRLSSNSEKTRICVSSGVPIPGCEVRIVDADTHDLPDGTVGEIAVKSASMFDGYRHYPEKTAEVLRDGWYYTGDYGFKHEENYYVIGRKKDIIIVAGNNIFPEDVEDVVGNVDGVIPGRVVAFAEEDSELGTDQVAVIVESPRTDDVSRRTLWVNIMKAGMSIDVSIKSVYLVPPRFLIKSSAGKPSRTANRERLVENQRMNRARFV